MNFACQSAIRAGAQASLNFNLTVLETSELLKKVRKIEIKTRGISNHIFAGEYQSAFRGRGMSFSEVREYQIGDDIRTIDWNVTARTGHPHVKIYEEERELTVMLLIDVSRSAFFGTEYQMKNEMITEICAVLSFSAITNNDKVGVIFFSNQVEKFIPPKKGKSHILRIIRELLDFHPQNQGTNISEALRYLNGIMKKRSIVFLLSDFMDKGYNDAITIANKRHDLVGIHTYDHRERELPNMGLVRVTDAESGRLTWLDTASGKVREQYRKWFDDHVAATKRIFHKSGADLLSISTRDSYVKSLIGFFKTREKKR